MTQLLITGSNRGIGLEFVKQYVQQPVNIIAACRDPEAANALNQLAKQYDNIEIIKLDVMQAADIKALKHYLEAKSLDILINCAGVIGKPSAKFLEVEAEDMCNTFKTNALAPLKVTQAAYAALMRGQQKKIINISTKMASIADNGSGGRYAYRSSKAALNMLSRCMAIDLAEQGFKVVALHPGWVQTDMGGPNALITPEQSVQGMRQVIDQLSEAQSGGFFDYKGERIPW